MPRMNMTQCPLRMEMMPRVTSRTSHRTPSPNHPPELTARSDMGGLHQRADFQAHPVIGEAVGVGHPLGSGGMTVIGIASSWI